MVAPVSKAVVHRFLMESVISAKMTLILGPYVHDDGLDGVQGFCVLAESHASVHITKDGYLFGDVFSCKEFGHHKILELARLRFGIDITNYQILNRGLEFLTPRLPSGG